MRGSQPPAQPGPIPGASPHASSQGPSQGAPPQAPPPPKEDDPRDAKKEASPSFLRAAGGGIRDAFSPVVRFFEVFGEHLILCARALSWLPRRPFRLTNYIESADYIGFGSLPIILLVGLFTGMVTALQAINAFSQFGLEAYAGGTTGKALAFELAPVLTALMLAGRASSGIATELGTMRISEQIDALESMAVNPLQFLVLPRLVAGLIVGPILSMLFFIIAMGGVFFVAIVIKHVDQGPFIAYTRDLLTTDDVWQCIIKGSFFGFIVCLIGCYQGYNAKGGGRGVGLGTTRAVVISSVTVLVTDYFLSQLLLEILAAPQGGA